MTPEDHRLFAKLHVWAAGDGAGVDDQVRASADWLIRFAEGHEFRDDPDASAKAEFHYSIVAGEQRLAETDWDALLGWKP